MKFFRYGVFQLFLLLAAGSFTCAASAEDVYGPPNLLKTMPTPFGPISKRAEGGSDATTTKRMSTLIPSKALRLPTTPQEGQQTPLVAPVTTIEIAPHQSTLPHRSLTDRLIASRLYLPGRLVLGRSAEFSIKGRPGFHAALAMADKDSGAKPIYGHNLRLGADRKLVSLGQIPDDGILNLFIETPIEGDLIGQNLYFEAALWSRPDFSDVEIAAPVTSEGQIGVANGVQVAKEPEKTRGIKIVPDATIPSQKMQRAGYSLDASGP